MFNVGECTWSFSSNLFISTLIFQPSILHWFLNYDVTFHFIWTRFYIFSWHTTLFSGMYGWQILLVILSLQNDLLQLVQYSWETVWFFLFVFRCLTLWREVTLFRWNFVSFLISLLYTRWSLSQKLLQFLKFLNHTSF